MSARAQVLHVPVVGRNQNQPILIPPRLQQPAEHFIQARQQRESLDELIHAVIQYRRLVRMTEPQSNEILGPVEGDPPRLGVSLRVPHLSEYPRRNSLSPPRSSLLPRNRGDR